MTDEADVQEVEIDPLAEPAAPVAPPPPADENPPTPAPTVDPVQGRINKITAEKYEEKRRADAAEAELEKLRGDNTPVAPSEAPTLESCDFDESKFNAATIEFQVQTQIAANATQEKQQTADDARRATVDTFAAKEAEFIKDNPGYSDTVKLLPQFNSETLDAIYSVGPQMAHYLGTHLDVADEIATASPVQAAMQLGRIAATMTASTKQIEQTNAPQPVDTLSGAAGVGKDLDEMSMDEIMAV